MEGATSKPPTPPPSIHEEEEEVVVEEEPLLSCGQVNSSTLAKLKSELGNGPMRFAPTQPERSVDEQIQSLNTLERSCFDVIKAKWQEKHSAVSSNNVFSDEMYLRFCRCSPGGKPFKDKAAWKMMKKFSKRYLQLTTDSLETSLRSKTVFPLPSLRTLEGLEVVYLRPSRHCVKTTDTRVVLDMLGYTLSTMMEREEPCTKGIVLLANMDEFAMCNYATDYWYQLMSMLQGQKVPVRIAQFLIVNPPKWFKNIWNLTEPMLTPDFVQRSEMIMTESDLSQYLAAGYEQYLPDEMITGHALTNKLVDDFVEYRKAVESVQGHQLAFLRRVSLTSGKQPESSSSYHTSPTRSEDNKSETISEFDVRAVYHSPKNSKPRDAIPGRSPAESPGGKRSMWNAFSRSSRRLVLADDKDEEEEEQQGSMWNASLFSRSSRRLVFADDKDEGEEEQQGSCTSISNNKQRPGVLRAASCKTHFMGGKVKDDESLPRVPRLGMGLMMQRQPSSDNLRTDEENGDAFSRPGLRRRDQPSSSRSLLINQVGTSPSSPRRSSDHDMLGLKSEASHRLSKTMEDATIMKTPKSRQRSFQMPRQQSNNSLLRFGEKTPTQPQRPKLSRQPSKNGKMSCYDKFSAEDHKIKNIDLSCDKLASPLRRPQMMRQRSHCGVLRQQSHSGLLCERLSEVDQTESRSISPRRFRLLRQLSQDRLPDVNETPETTSKRRGGKRADLVKQRPSERLLEGCPKTPTARSGTRREMSRAMSFKSFLLSSPGQTSSSPGGSKMAKQ